MKNKKIIYLLVTLMILSSFAGCKKTTDIYKYVNSDYIEDVWVEDEIVSSADDTNSDDETTEIPPTSSEEETENPIIPQVPVITVSDKYEPAPEDFMTDYTTPYKMEKINSQFDTKANELRNMVLNAKDEVNVTGKKWYVSSKGDDKNDGSTPDTAWGTLAALKDHKYEIKAGDAVLFERGSVFRGSFTANSGVYYGAYGTGTKPQFFGSHKADKDEWVDKGSNIWCYEGSGFTKDVGQVIFNHGEAVGSKKTDKASLVENYDFYVEYSKLHIYCDDNPAKKFASIEIATDGTILSIPSKAENVTIDNLTIKYTGGHGIQTAGSAKKITIKNCELGYLGGSFLSGYGDGTTPYGNAIEFWNGCEDSTVTNCWIYQIFDSGITHQGDGKYIVKNLNINKNLIEYCGFGSIEYWHNNQAINSMENVTYDSNISRFAGYGIGGKRNGKGYHIHSNPISNDNKATNFVIKNNIFDIAYDMMFFICSKAGDIPVMSGNTYSQFDGRKLGTYNLADYNFVAGLNDLPFDATAIIVHNTAN